MNFVKFLKTPFLAEHLRWLLLYVEYFRVLEYLIRSAKEMKRRKVILTQPIQKKGKLIFQETTALHIQLPGKKDRVSLA